MLAKCASPLQSENFSTESHSEGAQTSEYTYHCNSKLIIVIDNGNLPSERTPESLPEEFEPPIWGPITGMPPLEMQAIPSEIDWVRPLLANHCFVLTMSPDTFRFHHAAPRPHATIPDVELPKQSDNGVLDGRNV
jgi:hypothetical protein